MTRTIATAWMLVVALAAAAAAQPAATLAERTKGLSRLDGFVPLYWDAARGRVLAEVPAFDSDVLYYVSAASGAGSVELPFDRGILGTEVIHFQRSGPRVLVVAQNQRYRAVGGTPAQTENVRDSFASSVLAALPVEADENGRVLVPDTHNSRVLEYTSEGELLDQWGSYGNGPALGWRPSGWTPVEGTPYTVTLTFASGAPVTYRTTPVRCR